MVVMSASRLLLLVSSRVNRPAAPAAAAAAFSAARGLVVGRASPRPLFITQTSALVDHRRHVSLCPVLPSARFGSVVPRTERLATVQSEAFISGRRHFEVDLRRDANGRHFVKVTEFSGSRRSSLLIAADDADDFLVAFLGLDSGDGAAGEDSGLVEQRIEGFSKLDCSFKKGRFFELSLNENRHGKFYRLKEQSISLDGFSRTGTVMMEYEGKEKLSKAVKTVMEKHPHKFATLDKKEEKKEESGANSVVKDHLA